MLKKLFLALLLTVAVVPAHATTPTLGGPFSLMDNNGKRVTEKTYAGKYMLVYFGTTTNDPMTLESLKKIAEALDTMGDGANKAQVIFITVDPERDTKEKMSEFVKGISPRIIGLTGTRAEIDNAMAAYKAFAQKMPDPADQKSYTYFHPDFIYVMSPQGTFYTLMQASFAQKDFNTQLNAVIR